MLTTNFYRIQIPDPTTKQIIVAPYISFSIQCERAEVQGTYGKGYPIHNHHLEPIPVDYYCPPFTPNQITLFDATAEHAHALTTVVTTLTPFSHSPLTNTSVGCLPKLFLAYCTITDTSFPDSCPNKPGDP